MDRGSETQLQVGENLKDMQMIMVLVYSSDYTLWKYMAYLSLDISHDRGPDGSFDQG